MFTENVTVYFFSGVGPFAGLAPAGCAGAAAVPVVAGPPGFAATFAGAGTFPN